jgi:putative ABC transport system permease protein
VAIATVALGVGVNIAVFGVFYGLALRELPFPESSDLVQVETRHVASSSDWTSLLSVQSLEDIAAQSRALRIGYSMEMSLSIWSGAAASALTGAAVSGDFFGTYGVAPLLGRFIMPADTGGESEAVVVLSFSCWQRTFGADPDIVGKVVNIGLTPNGVVPPVAVPRRPHTVVGVMPERKVFPIAGDVWVQIRGSAYTAVSGPSGASRMLRSMAGVARINPAFTFAQARNELHLISRNIAAANPLTDGEWDITARSLQDVQARSYKAALSLLLATGAGIVLLTCVNISSLLAARGRMRYGDSAIRQALGASRRRIYQQCLCESVLLAGVGGAVSVLVAVWTVRAAAAVAPATDAFLYEMTLDWAVLSYAAALTLATGVTMGLVPAAKASSVRLMHALSAHQAAHASPAAFPFPVRGRGLIIGIQLAMAVPLVVGSALAAQSLGRLVNVDLGLQFEGVTAVAIGPSPEMCETVEDCVATVTEILEGVTTTPGVAEAAVVGMRPFGPTVAYRLIEESEPRPGRPILAAQRAVGTTYFKMFGIRLLQGREFTRNDTFGQPTVAVVNEAFAREKFGGDAIGRQLSRATGRRDIVLTVVGQVRDAREFSPARRPTPTVYIPLTQARQMPSATLLYRTRDQVSSIQPLVRSAILRVDPAATVDKVQSLDDVVSEMNAVPVFQVYLLVALAIVGMTIALIGIYGLISYSMNVRMKEFGLRVALGATPRQIVRGVMAESFPAIAFGLLIGAALSLASWRVFRQFLFEAGPADAIVVMGALAAMATCAAVAYYIPSRSASRSDPTKCLRES